MRFKHLSHFVKPPEFILLNLIKRISVSKRLSFKSKFIDFRRKPNEIEMQKPDFKKTAATQKKNRALEAQKYWLNANNAMKNFMLVLLIEKEAGGSIAVNHVRP